MVMNSQVESSAMDESGIGWGAISTAVTAVVGGLTTAVVALWKSSESKNAKAIQSLEARAEDCEKDRDDLRVRVAKLEERHGVKNG